MPDPASRPLRSCLFVPADSEAKLAKGLDSGADALILDLEDSIAPARKAAAREIAGAFLRAHLARPGRPALFVRVNGLATGLTEADLDAAVLAGAEAIVLPKAEGGVSIQHLGAKIAMREAEADLPDGAVRILAIGTETPRAAFQLGTFAGASRRLIGLTWGGEDLATALGARGNRLADGSYADPYRLVRALTLMGAAAAGVEPIDSVYPAYRDLDGLRAECAAALFDGFTGKLAIHPAQVPVINEVFTPSEADLARARAIVAAFEADPGAGVVGLDGAMLDQPHLALARKLLARAGGGAG